LPNTAQLQANIIAQHLQQQFSLLTNQNQQPQLTLISLEVEQLSAKDALQQALNTLTSARKHGPLTLQTD